MSDFDAQKAELVAFILAPHEEHRFGACGDDLCDDCQRDLALALARGAEREACAALVEAELAILMGPPTSIMQLGSVRARIKALAAAVRSRGDK